MLRDDLGIPGGGESSATDSGSSGPVQCTEESGKPPVLQSKQPPVAMVTGQQDPKCHALGRHPEGIQCFSIFDVLPSRIGIQVNN